MSASRIAAWRRRARVRRIAYVVAGTLPVAAALGWIAWPGSRASALALVTLVVLVALALAWRTTRAIDTRRIARQLDEENVALDDSAALADAEAAELTPLERLQRERVRARLVTVAPPAHERVPWRALLAAWAVALAIAVAPSLWTPQSVTEAPAVGMRESPVPPPPTRITRAALAITPPAYTGLASRTESTLAARVEAGSSLRWTLAVEPKPGAVSLAFHDGTTLALAHDADGWTGTRVLERSTLYRVEVAGVAPLAERASHRLEVVPDRPPEIRVVEPDRTLVALAPGQHEWTLVFEASDDYGLAGAQLQLTQAKGTGENITVSRSTLALRGEGTATTKRYRHVVALAPHALEPGDDLIAKLVVRDNRAPSAQAAQSASYILRAPFEPAAESSGVEGLVRDTLPAYFRSQRQIIIDTEALLAAAPKLAKDVFVDRSDAIGVDQRLLRLRYGQFLGEQTSAGEGEHAAAGEHAEEGEHAGEGEPAAHAEALQPGATSREVLEAFGHTHDDAEAATLLDPETRKLLRAALGEMWDAERRLRSGEPAAALPFEHRALDYIKQVQQASRIYLARVGLELPQLDETRRLAGDRAGARDTTAALARAAASELHAAPVTAWSALARGEAPDLAALEAWVRANEAELPDALDWYELLERLARDAGCLDCRLELTKRLWAALPEVPAGVATRPAHDSAARAYLDALEVPR